MTSTKTTNQDSDMYRAPDSGCRLATTFLDQQSFCFRCPFRKCVYDMTGSERNQLIGMMRRGIRPSFMLVVPGDTKPVRPGRSRFGITEEMIYEALRRHRDDHGPVKAAARDLGCSRSYIYKYVPANKVREVIEL